MSLALYMKLLLAADSMSLSSPPGTSVQSPRDFDKCDAPLPQEVQQLPENLQNLLMGCIASARTTTKTRKIVIYVCAADSQGKHMLTYLLSYLLSPWSRVLLEKLTSLQLVKKLPAFY
jgi:hypothetical protein